MHGQGGMRSTPAGCPGRDNPLKGTTGRPNPQRSATVAPQARKGGIVMEYGLTVVTVLTLIDLFWWLRK